MGLVWIYVELNIYFPSELNATEMTASAWPSIVLEHRVTERTLKWQYNKVCALRCLLVVIQG